MSVWNRERRTTRYHSPYGEGLEGRQLLAAPPSAQVINGVLKVYGEDDAKKSDKLDVQIADDFITLWSNDQALVIDNNGGGSRIATSKINAIDIDGKAGDDTIKVAQRGAFAKTDGMPKMVTAYGGKGADTLLIDIDRDYGDNDASRLVLGTNYGFDGTDANPKDVVKILNWYPNSLTVNNVTAAMSAQEAPVGTLAWAQKSLHDAKKYPFLADPFNNKNNRDNWYAPITSSEGSRTAASYLNVIQEFEPKRYDRYKAHKDATGHFTDTYCNVYANDVTRAMGVGLPMKSGTGQDYIPAGTEAIQDQLRKGWGGWKKAADVDTILNKVRAGKPVVGVLFIKDVVNHISVVRPDQPAGPAQVQDLRIAQAGAENRTLATIADEWKSKYYDKIEFYYHE